MARFVGPGRQMIGEPVSHVRRDTQHLCSNALLELPIPCSSDILCHVCPSCSLHSWVAVLLLGWLCTCRGVWLLSLQLRLHCVSTAAPQELNYFPSSSFFTVFCCNFTFSVKSSSVQADLHKVLAENEAKSSITK